MINLRRTRAVARKEMRHILRDPRSLLMALALPAVMLLLFGWALTLDVDQLPTLILDRDQTPQSRNLISLFQGSTYFEVLGLVDDYATIEREIDSGRCVAGVVIDPGFHRDIAEGGQAQLQIFFDGSDSNTASIGLGYVEGLLEGYSNDLMAQQVQRQGLEFSPPVEARQRIWYNSQLESKNYVVPGLVAVILMVIAALLTSLTIARERETGTLEQLLATPVRASELVLGKLSAYFAVGAVDTVIAIVMGVAAFGVPLRGSLLLLAISCAIFLFGALCWGILISAAAPSQILAYQLGLITTFLPAFLLSGFVFAISNMPLPIQAVTHIVPARYFITMLVGIFLKGSGLGLLAGEMVFLTVFCLLVFVAATKKLQKKVA